NDKATSTPAATPRVRWLATPAQFADEFRRLDRALLIVIAVLAFFLASFAIGNTDFWMHLATGRLLINGAYTFGVDPFAYTTSGQYWANHSWLFDLCIYGLASLGGGPENLTAGIILVVAKAVVTVAALALMIAIHRPDQNLFVPAICAALAILAM